VGGPSQYCGQFGGVVASGSVDLRLGEEERTGEISAFQPGVTKVRTDQVRLPQISVA
jgi:hypothetical protein